MRNYRFIITGKVQHVWYRKNICDNSQKLGVSGYVKNLEDGRVEAGACLEDADFAKFVAILEEGSPSSIVDNIEQFPCEELFVGEFEIR